MDTRNGSSNKSFGSSGCLATPGSFISRFRLGISPLVNGDSCVMSYRSLTMIKGGPRFQQARGACRIGRSREPAWRSPGALA